jgi:flagellar biosynthesis protein FlhF
MRLKSFQAKTMNDALRQVKDTLGDDAIIVSTREEAGMVRITAAVEQMPEPKAPQQAAAAPARQVAEFSEDDTLDMITDTLLRHRVPGQVSEKILSAAAVLNNHDPQETLARALEKTFRFEKQAAAAKAVLLAGPPGAGKTLMSAKMAASAVMDGKKPCVITTDIARAGGVEQLGAFLNILEVTLHQAEDPATLKRILAAADPSAPVIIDTGGLNPFDPQEMKFMAKLMAAADIESALVLPAGLDAEESAEMAMTFEILGIRKIIPTRLDFARRIGGILSAADRAGLTFHESSHTPQVANGITHLTPSVLAQLLMPAVAKETKTKRGLS